MLDKIIEKNFQRDSRGSPRLLVFHNFAYNSSLIVEVTNFQLTQSMENNMMWNYSIEMKAVADYKLAISSAIYKGNLTNLLLQ